MAGFPWSSRTRGRRAARSLLPTPEESPSPSQRARPPSALASHNEARRHLRSITGRCPGIGRMSGRLRRVSDLEPATTWTTTRPRDVVLSALRRSPAVTGPSEVISCSLRLRPPLRPYRTQGENGRLIEPGLPPKRTHDVFGEQDRYCSGWGAVRRRSNPVSAQREIGGEAGAGPSGAPP